MALRPARPARHHSVPLGRADPRCSSRSRRRHPRLGHRVLPRRVRCSRQRTRMGEVVHPPGDPDRVPHLVGPRSSIRSRGRKRRCDRNDGGSGTSRGLSPHKADPSEDHRHSGNAGSRWFGRSRGTDLTHRWGHRFIVLTVYGIRPGPREEPRRCRCGSGHRSLVQCTDRRHAVRDGGDPPLLLGPPSQCDRHHIGHRRRYDALPHRRRAAPHLAAPRTPGSASAHPVRGSGTRRRPLRGAVPTHPGDLERVSVAVESPRLAHPGRRRSRRSCHRSR